MTIPIDAEFRFLVDQHGFNQKSEGDSISYESPTLVVRPSFNERDGFDIRVVCPLIGPEDFYIGTLLAALTEAGPQANSSYTSTMNHQASFLRANLERLFGIPAEIHHDCCELQFWHAPDYREEWGTAIKMDAAAIREEEVRLERIRSFFTEPVGRDDQ